MPNKPSTASGYGRDLTIACERTLVTLLRGLGTLKPHMRLIGGLVPRYLTPANPPHVPEHAGSQDVDMAVDLAVLASGEGYRPLGSQLKASGFSRALGKGGKPVNWRWQRTVDARHQVVVEFLTDESAGLAGRPIALDGENVSALPIPHCSVVRDWYQERTVSAELLDGGGITVETVLHADLTAFITLKASAIEQRTENKDPADLVHVLMYANAGDLERSANEFLTRRQQRKHGPALELAVQTLRRRFCTDGHGDGHLKDGPVAVANFAGLGAGDARVRLQRDTSGLVTEFLRLVESSPRWTL